MENTLENKAKFFSQYWGQHLGCNNFGTSGIQLNHVIFQNVKFLQLKPLSSITDEDALHICSFQAKGNYRVSFTNAKYVVDNMKSCDVKMLLSLEIIDYLRSKGYALPYMGLSVEKLIEYGWVKLNV